MEEHEATTPTHVVQIGSLCHQITNESWAFYICPVCLAIPNADWLYVHKGVEELYH